MIALACAIARPLELPFEGMWSGVCQAVGQANPPGSEGLTASDLPILLYGFTALERLRNGEGAASVARLLASSRSQGQGWG
jgi:hypothetical protein